MNKYKITVKYPTTYYNDFQDDTLDLETIQDILAQDKCVIIGKTLYTFDNIISIEQL